jgi:hypothetical protein
MSFAIDTAIAGIASTATAIPHPLACVFILTTGISIGIGRVSLGATGVDTEKVAVITATASG